MKKFLIIFILVFIISTTFLTTNYAAVPVTQENLSTAFKKFVESNQNDDNLIISVSEGFITITSDNKDYIVNYKLTGKPTFSFEIPINKGISYDNFKDQIENLTLPIFGYIAVANIQGVSMEDAATYGLLSLLEDSLSGSINLKDSYKIVDDLAPTEDGVTLIKGDDPKTIYTSEFGDRVIEYVDNYYPTTQTISDSKDTNSYVMTIEKKDVTETSCKLVSTLEVNTDADFSKLNGYTNKFGNSFLGSEITKENADIEITLKVGQKCKLETNEKITNFASFGNSGIEFNDTYTEITTTNTGTRKGYFNVGNNKKTFYITVEENTENKPLETKVIKISTPSTNNSNSINNQQEVVNVNKVTSSINKLPQTGDFFNIKDGLFLLILVCFIGMIFLIIPNIKYKNSNKK